MGIFHSCTDWCISDSQIEVKIKKEESQKKLDLPVNNILKEPEIRNEIEINNEKFEKGKEEQLNNLIKEEKEKNEKNEIIIENLRKEQKDKEIEHLQILEEKNNTIKKLEIENQELKSGHGVILRGLNNIGATCYMNATLEAFSHTKELTKFFLEDLKDAIKDTLSYEYQQVVINLWDKNSNAKSYSPNSFKIILSKLEPMFEGAQANDSKDLVNFLLQQFHRELNRNKNGQVLDNHFDLDQRDQNLMYQTLLQDFPIKYNSIIGDLFYGIKKEQTQCENCQTMTFNFQIFSFLEFPLEQVNIFCANVGVRPLKDINGNNPEINLFECFEYSKRMNILSGQNALYCNYCQQESNAMNGSFIRKAPDVLILFLNRGKGAVYECKVNFPNILNILNYVEDKSNSVYELYSVIVHHGPSSNSGHFVAYCKHKDDNNWYLYNDCFVTLCKEKEEYKNGMPYILFYRVLK